MLETIARHKKALVVVAVLTIVLGLLAELIPEPASVDVAVVSPALLLIGIFIMVLPIFAAIVGGWMVAKREQELAPALVVPLLGTVIGGLAIMVFGIVQLMLLGPEGWQAMYTQISDLGMDMFQGMSLEEFKSFMIFAAAIGAVFIVIINGALGAAGGAIGRALAMHGASKPQASKPGAGVGAAGKG